MIAADLFSDCGGKRVKFDATSWFQMATSEQILNLYECGGSHDYASDDVAHWMAENGDSTVENFFEFLRYVTHQPFSGDTNGFECDINMNEALQWIKFNRPEIYLHLKQNLSEHIVEKFNFQQ
jgi:hypothetical protein